MLVEKHDFVPHYDFISKGLLEVMHKKGQQKSFEMLNMNLVSFNSTFV
jgi:hypothetical protein